MSRARISSPWLTDDMAHALAAASPPLRTWDVTQAADELTADAKPTRVIGQLLKRGADLSQVRTVVEALRALRDISFVSTSPANPCRAIDGKRQSYEWPQCCLRTRSDFAVNGDLARRPCAGRRALRLGRLGGPERDTRIIRPVIHRVAARPS